MNHQENNEKMNKGKKENREETLAEIPQQNRTMKHTNFVETETC